MRIFLISIFLIFSNSALAVQGKIAAIVNDEIISTNNLNNRLNLHLKLANLEIESERQKKFLQHQMINALIIEKLVEDDAIKNSEFINQKELDSAIEQIASDSGMSVVQLKSSLGLDLFNSLTSQVRFEIFQKSIVINKLSSKINVSDIELNEILNIEKIKFLEKIYTIAHLQIPKSDFKDESYLFETIAKMRATKNCKEFSKKAKEFYLSSYNNKYEVTMSGMKDAMKKIITNLKVGSVSKIYQNDGKNLDVFMLCAIKTPKNNVSNESYREKIRSIVQRNKVVNELKRHINSLVSKAFIEVKI